MNFEICTDSVEGALAAVKYGAKRIELCAALSVGGLTPNIGLVEGCANTGIAVNAIVRHKEGGFVYNADDVSVMKLDIKSIKEAGGKGVVFGILTADHEISELNKELCSYAKSLGLEVTFHRAFDFVKDYKSAIKKVIEMGFDRLLTSGLKPKVVDGLDVITYLQENHGLEIEIQPGSGVNPQNALKLAATGIQNLHFTARKSSGGETSLGMGELMEVDEDKIKDIIDLFK
ncbi:copper homeostasis protein CutC [Urechidicola vernalis]|uniref:PF03932 family protein CutC n=1 Tax=Urechidicola vernalis TaxID=3075600 RepID=A0ABU2Y472_9FLAO|nr:copper homeostasis protein CutC [Urechidicola sp. P050]MDT0552055.1 copper homeostasis protein CutC [Urechidicola sp. P050]